MTTQTAKVENSVRLNLRGGGMLVARLLKYLWPYRARFGLALIGLLGGTSISLVFPYVIQNLIDGVLRDGNLAALDRIAMLLGLLFIFQFVFGFTERFMVEYVGERVVIDLREAVYAHLHQLPVAFFNARRSGEIVSRLASDAGQIRTALTTNLAWVLGEVLTLTGAVLIVFLLNWRLTLFVLALAPVLGLFAAFFGGRIEKISTEVTDEVAGSSAIVEEAMQGIREVKAFVREEFEVARYRRAMDRTFAAALRLTRLRAVFGPLIFSLMFMGIAAVLWFGGREVVAGRLTAGGLTSFLFYMFFIAGSFGAFTGIYTQLQEAAGASRRIFEIMDTEPEIQDKPGALTMGRAEGRIAFEGLSFTYDERADVLEDISLEIAPGEVLALVGPSGAGKSTFVSLIPRFYDPTAGRITLDGQDLRDLTQASLRAQIAIVPQDALLFGGSIRENILYGRLDASEAALIDAARAANAHEFISELPDGYETIVGERGLRLSGGQRQRVAIARALLKDPRILLLDEATSSLDSVSERLVQEALERLMQGRTTVIIAHRLSTVQVADRIAVLEKGRLIELGDHAALLARSGLYARLWKMQFEAGLKEMIEASLD